jgi:hypothetical protein
MEREHTINETCRTRTVTVGRLRRRDKAELAFAGSLRSQGLVCTLVFASFCDVKTGRCKVCGCRPRDFLNEFQSSERWRSQCASGTSPAISSPSCALARFDAIDARRLLHWLFPRPIVASWHAMTVRISGSDLAGPATVEHVSIRGRSRSSNRSRSRSARRAAILGG